MNNLLKRAPQKKSRPRFISLLLSATLLALGAGVPAQILGSSPAAAAAAPTITEAVLNTSGCGTLVGIGSNDVTAWMISYDNVSYIDLPGQSGWSLGYLWNTGWYEANFYPWVKVRNASNLYSAAYQITRGSGNPGACSSPFKSFTPVVATTTAPSGTAALGSTLTSQVSFVAAPISTSLTYSWQSCSSASDLNTCSTISGETNATYVATSNDVNNFIRSIVVGTSTVNGVPSSTTATSELTQQISSSAPGVPGIPTAIAGYAQATVTVSAANSGGIPTSYIVTASPQVGGITKTCTVLGASGSCVVTGLTNGEVYTFTSTATNGSGTSLESSPSAGATPFDTVAPTVTLAAAVITSTTGTITFTITGDLAIDCSSLSTTSGTDFTYTGISAITGIVQTTSNICTITATSTATGNAIPVVSSLVGANSFAIADNTGHTQTILNGSPQSTTVTIPDVTAPTLSSPSADKITDISARLRFASDEAGTYYYLVYAASDTAPSALEIEAQGTAVSKGTSAAILGVNTVTATGLSAGTAYKSYIIVKDPSGYRSEVSTISLTTLLAAPGIPEAPTTVAGNTQVTVTVVPAIGGETPVSYSVVAYTNIGGIAGSCVVTGASGSCVVTGLTNGSAYTFQSKANGSAGHSSSSYSSASISTIPLAPPAPTATQAIPTTTLVKNVAVTSFIPVTGSGGTPSYTFTISPTLTTGLSISASTGAITGTPTATKTATTYTVTITDSASPTKATATNTFSLTIIAALAATQSIPIKVVTDAQIVTSFVPVTGSGGTGTLTYSISPALPSGLAMSTTTGAITGTPVGVGSATTYTVTVTDSASTPVTASNTFSLAVSTALTTTLVIPSKTLTPNYMASFIPVTSSGGADPIVYSISGYFGNGTLAINSATGEIFGTPAGTQTTTNYTVTATDANGATSSQVFSLSFANLPTTTLAISTKTVAAGVAVTSFKPVTTSSGAAPVTFSLSTPLPSGLSMDPATGAITGTPAASSASTTYPVTVTDANGYTSSKTFTLIVTGPFSTTLAIPIATLTASKAGTFTPVTTSGGIANFTYTISPALPGTLAISSSTGVISGNPPASAVASANYTVTVTDGNATTSSQTFALIISAPLTTTVLVSNKNATGGAFLSYTPVTSAGGTAPIVYTVTGNTLAAGLTVNAATGVISGTPTSTANAVYNFIATDANGATSTKSFIMYIVGGLSATLSIASKTLTQGVVATSFTPVTGSGGQTGYLYSVSPALPAGLTMSSAGAITGTPTASSVATSYTVTVTDANGATASQVFALTINSPLTTSIAIATEVLTVGILTTFIPVTSAGGLSPVAYSVSPALPAGLTLNTATGEISGTPTTSAVSANFTITARDAGAVTSAKTFAITISPTVSTTLVIATETLTAGTAATSFTPVTGSGGTAPLVYSVSPTLPASLSLNSATGAITGTAGASALSTNYTVTVTEANGATSSQTFALVINGGLTTTLVIPIETMTATKAGTTFAPVTASGGTAAITYAISPALPTPLTLNTATGLISGTPAAAALSANYIVTATDANGATSAQTFALVIVAGPTSTVVTPKAITASSSVSFTPVTGSGGASPLAYSVSSLPAGLVINSATGAITGSTTSALAVVSTNYTVTVTDANGATSTQIFALVITAALTTTLVIPTKTLTALKTGIAFTPVTSTGGKATVAFSIVPSLPSPLLFSTSTGGISGTPSSAAASTNYTVTATDANGATSSQTFALDISAALTTTLAIPTKTITAGKAGFTFTPVTSSGGTAPITYTISVALTAPLTMNSATGLISGTPAAALASVSRTITATDANGATSAQSFALIIVAVPTATQAIATETLTANSAASFTPVTGASGTAPLVYSISPTLPADLSLNTATGAITGTPTTSATSVTYTVTVTDAYGVFATKTFALVISPALVATQSIPTKSLTMSALVTSFVPVTGSGGTPTLTYAVSPALPTGLTMAAATGAITGTPSVTSVAATYTVIITDSASLPKATATNTFSLAVTGALTTAVVTPKAITANSPVSFTPVSASGGATPLDYSISPALPAGLSLDSSTGSITGSTTSALAVVSTNYTVTVTDANNATSSKVFALVISVALTTNLLIPTETLTATKSTTFIPVTYTGGKATVVYSIAPALPNGLTFTTTSGSITGPTTSALAVPSTNYTVTATDANGATSAQTFILIISAPPTASVITPEAITASASVSFTPVTGSGGVAPLTYSVPSLPTGLTLNTSTGAITGSTSSALAVVATNYTITVTDVNGATVAKTFSLVISAALTTTIVIATQTLTANSAASFTPITGSGGASPLAYSVSPTLPAGLSLNTVNGLITGTPTTSAALTNYTVTVTDANGVTSSKSFAATVNGPLSATQIIPNNLLTSGLSASLTPVSGGGGTAPLSYSVAPILPTGLSINASTGAITGTPSGTSTATTYTVTVTDALLAVATNTFSITVAAAITTTLVIATETLTANAVAISFTPVTATGGTAPVVYSISPALPTTLSINTSTGAITGTPASSAVSANYTVTATDVNGATSAKTFALVISTGLSTTLVIATETLTANSAASFTPVTATGGTSPVAYSVSPTLPAGLSLNTTTGAITGTPTSSAASANYTVTATDVNGAISAKTFALVISTGLSTTLVIATETLTANAVATSFTPVTATGGTSPLVYSITPALPTTLSLNAATGAITGTPAASAASANYTVTATDVNGAISAKTFALVISTGLSTTLVIATETLTSSAAATSFTPVTGSGGTAPLAYSISPALPSGLSINTSTGAITGTPAASAASANYTVTATDANSATSSKTFALVISAALTTTLVIATETLTANSAASFTPVTAAGGTAPVVYSVSPTLPASLSLNTANGAITGTPASSAASVDYTVTATDVNGATSAKTFALAISAALTTTLVIATETLTANSAASFTPVTAADGTTPLVYSISPALPTGLAINASTGAITGTPTASAALTNYTVTATDANSATSAKVFALVVAGPLAATQAVPVKTVGALSPVASFTPVIGSGGTAPLTYGVLPALPAGLAMASASGAITGTPTATSSVTIYTVTVSDTLSANVTNTFSLTIVEALTAAVVISDKTLPIDTVTNFTPVVGSGGVGPLTYSISPALVSGLIINSATGEITGTSTTSSVLTTYTVAITDASNVLISKVFTLTVNPAPTPTPVVPTPVVPTPVAPKPEVPKPEVIAAAKVVVEKVVVDTAIAVAAAKVAVEKAVEAVAVKVAAEKIAAEVEKQVTVAAVAEKAAVVAAVQAVEVLKSTTTEAVTKATTSPTTQKAVVNAATTVKAAAAAAIKTAMAKAVVANANKPLDIAIGTLASKTASAASQAAADVIAAAAKAAANQSAKVAADQATSAKNAADVASKAATAAAALIATEQKQASDAAILAKTAADAMLKATLEKSTTTAAAQTAADAVVQALNAKVKLADDAVKATDETVRLAIVKKIDEASIKVADLQKVADAAVQKADSANKAQEVAKVVSDAAVKEATAQAAQAVSAKAESVTKTAEAVQAAVEATVAAKVATSAKAEAAKVPATAGVVPKASTTKKNSAQATVTGLKRGQKVKVTINIKVK